MQEECLIYKLFTAVLRDCTQWEKKFSEKASELLTFISPLWGMRSMLYCTEARAKRLRPPRREAEAGSALSLVISTLETWPP